MLFSNIIGMSRKPRKAEVTDVPVIKKQKKKASAC